MPPRKRRRRKAPKTYPRHDYYDARPRSYTAEQVRTRQAALAVAFGVAPDSDHHDVGKHPAFAAYREAMGWPKAPKPRKVRRRGPDDTNPHSRLKGRRT